MKYLATILIGLLVGSLVQAESLQDEEDRLSLCHAARMNGGPIPSTCLKPTSSEVLRTLRKQREEKEMLEALRDHREEREIFQRRKKLNEFYDLDEERNK